MRKKTFLLQEERDESWIYSEMVRNVKCLRNGWVAGWCDMNKELEILFSSSVVGVQCLSTSINKPPAYLVWKYHFSFSSVLGAPWLGTPDLQPPKQPGPPLPVSSCSWCRHALKTTGERRQLSGKPTPVRHIHRPPPLGVRLLEVFTFSGLFGHEEQTRPTGQGSDSEPTRHVELRRDSPATQRPADGRERLLQLAHQTLPRGLPEDLRGQRVSLLWSLSFMMYMTVNTFSRICIQLWLFCLIYRCCHHPINKLYDQWTQYKHIVYILIIWPVCAAERSRSSWEYECMSYNKVRHN